MTDTAIVITLTSIPPRFAHLPRKFAALERQSSRPHRVELNIPRSYRRFPGAVPALPPLPDWVDVVSVDQDLGPATKVLPTARRWQGQAVDLLICDDDRLPDRQWLTRFAEARKDRPRDILCERGWNIAERFGIDRTAQDLPRAVACPRAGRDAGYRLKRLATLGLHKPMRNIYRSPGYVDVLEGFLGALIPVGAIPERAFDIPDIVWTVDDVWISGMAYHAGHGVWAHGQPRPVSADGAIDHVASLRDHVEAGHDRESADSLAVRYLRETFGVWP